MRLADSVSSLEIRDRPRDAEHAVVAAGVWQSCLARRNAPQSNARSRRNTRTPSALGGRISALCVRRRCCYAAHAARHHDASAVNDRGPNAVHFVVRVIPEPVELATGGKGIVLMVFR